MGLLKDVAVFRARGFRPRVAKGVGIWIDLIYPPFPAYALLLGGRF